jgi:nucleoside-diphosphate kinase
MPERTLVLIKPDAVKRQLIGEIIRRLEQKNLRIIAMKMLQFDNALADAHYSEHVSKDFYPALKKFITSGPCIAMVVEGRGAIIVVRNIIGNTDPIDALPGSIRGDLALEVTQNLVHGSDSPATAKKEIPLFFSPQELFSASSKD